MVYAYAQTDPAPAEPYLTAAEYKQAPTGVDPSNLVKGDQAASLAELGNVIARASSWADTLCSQVLAATPDVEGGRVTVSRDGTLRIHPRQTPIIEVTGIAYGATPGSLVEVADLSGVWVESAMIVVPMTTVSPLYMGSLGFATVIPGRDVYAQWRYVAGWPNTLLYSPTGAGDTQITVTNPCGVIPGSSQLTIYDGAQTETVTVAPGYTPGASTLTLTAALRFAHPNAGISVSALPPAVKQAVILLTSALIKTRGSSAMVLQSVRGEPSRKATGESGAVKEIELAEQLLAPFRRVR